MAGIKDPITDSQRAAARALIEGEPPTHGRVAACMGVNVTTVSHWASEESWASLDFRNLRVKKAHRGLIALAKALREGEADDPLGALSEAERDALAASGLDETADPPVMDADAAAVQELADLPHGERAARIGSILTRRIETILVAVEAGRAVETRQVLALNALVQLAERITTMTPEDRRAAQLKSDAEVAEIYDQIEKRIGERALYFCRQVLERRFGIPRKQVEELVPIDRKNPTRWPKNAPRVHIIIQPVDEEYADLVQLKGPDLAASLLR